MDKDTDKGEEKKKMGVGKKAGIGCLGIIVVLIVVGIIAAANGSKGGNTSVTTTPASTSSTTTKSTTNATAHVGSTLDIGGSSGLAIDLQQVIDPAQGADQFTTPDAGKRFVATLFQITDKGTGAYTDDANSNVTLIGSDNQSYTADFNSVSECTNFSSGQYTLASGESATGCVIFQLPDAIKPAKVQFQTESGFLGDTGEWLIP
jgi:hypothetical protein